MLGFKRNSQGLFVTNLVEDLDDVEPSSNWAIWLMTPMIVALGQKNFLEAGNCHCFSLFSNLPWVVLVLFVRLRDHSKSCSSNLKGSGQNHFLLAVFDSCEAWADHYVSHVFTHSRCLEPFIAVLTTFSFHIQKLEVPCPARSEGFLSFLDTPGSKRCQFPNS